MLSVILKGTNSCNMTCSYCSLGKKTDIKIISEETLLEAIRYACKVCGFRRENKLVFIFHGGEPTLIDTKVYTACMDRIIKEFPNIHIEYAMQTNGLEIGQEWLLFFKKYNVSVGVSIDGSKNIHDSERKSMSSIGTYGAVTKNIIKMLENGVNVSCLMVLTSNALKEGYEYLKFFHRWNLQLKINPLLNYGEAYEHPELSLKDGQYANYLIEAYRYIMHNRLNVVISPLDKIVRGILTDKHVHECSFQADCNRNFLCIDFDGNIYPCGKYADMRKAKIGNIKDAKVDVMAYPLMNRLVMRRNEGIPLKCKECKYLSMCNVGCNAEASIEKIYADVPKLCEDYRKLFDFFYKEGLILMKKKLVELRNNREVVLDGV